MTFQEMVSECLKSDELIAEFNRLSGYRLGARRSGFEKAFDDVCGYDPDAAAIPAFVDFVYRCVWLPLRPEQFDNSDDTEIGRVCAGASNTEHRWNDGHTQ